MAEFGTLEHPSDDGDKIIIHLGKVLPERVYDYVVQTVVEFMNKRWPDGNYYLPN